MLNKAVMTYLKVPSHYLQSETENKHKKPQDSWSQMEWKSTFSVQVIYSAAKFTPKVKAVPLHATKPLGGRGAIAPTHLNLGTIWGEWSSHLSCTLVPGKRLPVPTVQEARWAPESVWTQRLEEKSFHLCWGSNIDRPVIQPIARQYTDSYPAHKFTS
jgi:hypothetical protein